MPKPELELAPYWDRPPARFDEKWQRQRYSRTQHDQVDVVDELGWMRAQDEIVELDEICSDRQRVRIELVARSPIVCNDFRAFRSQQRARSDTAPAESYYQGSTIPVVVAHELPTRPPSPQLQCRQARKREHDPEDPETDDDLGLAPPRELEMMVERCHTKHTLTGELERRHLNDDRERFENEHAAYEHEQKLLLDEERHGTDGTAESERADVAHEKLRPGNS